jgi:hypothetical protein
MVTLAKLLQKTCATLRSLQYYDCTVSPNNKKKSILIKINNNIPLKQVLSSIFQSCSVNDTFEKESIVLDVGRVV